MGENVPWDAWKALAEAGDLDGALTAYVAEYDWVTFAELDRRFEAFMDVRGSMALHVPGYPTLIIWSDMSEAFCDLVGRALSEHRIFAHPAHTLTYLIDGGMLKLPVVKRLPRAGVTPKQERWLPVCLRVVPLAEKKRRKVRAS